MTLQRNELVQGGKPQPIGQHHQVRRVLSVKRIHVVHVQGEQTILPTAWPVTLQKIEIDFWTLLVSTDHT
jgi:hypothetical protein